MLIMTLSNDPIILTPLKTQGYAYSSDGTLIQTQNAAKPLTLDFYYCCCFFSLQIQENKWSKLTMQWWDDYSGQGGPSYQAINRIPQITTFKITKASFFFILQIPHGHLRLWLYVFIVLLRDSGRWVTCQFQLSGNWMERTSIMAYSS